MDLKESENEANAFKPLSKSQVPPSPITMA